MIRQYWLAVMARLRLRRLAEPRWWRWRKRWHRWNVQRTRWLQARSSRLDGQRKNFAVALGELGVLPRARPDSVGTFLAQRGLPVGMDNPV